MRTTALRTLAILLILGLALTACAAPVPAPAPSAPPTAAPAAAVAEPTAAPAAAAAEPTAAQPPAAKDPVFIGALIPLSEPGAPQAGQLILRGIELGAEYVNTVLGGSVDGRPVEIVVEDDKGTPEVGASGYRRLVQEKKVIGVTGCYHSSVCLAVNEVAKELGAPQIVTQGSNAAITASQIPQAFRTHLIDPIRAIALVDFAKNNGFKKVAIMADNTDFGVGLTAAVQAEGEKQGVPIKSVIYDRAAVDLTPELLEVRAWEPDLIMNGGTGKSEHFIIDQASDIGLWPKTAMVATSDWPYRSDEYWELHPENGTGIYILTAYHPSMELSERGQWLYDKYLAKYGEAPTYSTLNGFGDVILLAEAAKNAGSTDGKAVVAALEAGTFDFWAGTVTFPKGEGALWHQWTPPVLITQYTEAKQLPKDSKLVYTFNYSPE